MAEIHRKVELQEVDDLRYLITNVRRAADAKIDLALPPIEGEDALRQKVEELVHAYITQTFTLAAPSTLINGHPVPLDSPLLGARSPAAAADDDDVAEEFEPFSDALRERAARLLRQEEELLVEIGRLRRETPREAAGVWMEELGRGEEGAEEEGEVEVELGVERLERQEEVEASWRRGVEGLVRLKRELPATAARMERARGAGEYALAER